MILDYEIITTISNQGKYYESLGYPLMKQGSKLTVKIEHLPINSNKKVKCSCDSCFKNFARQYQLLMKINKIYKGHYCSSCSRKLIGKKIDMENTILKTKERVGENHPRWNPFKTEYKMYSDKVRSITENTYEKNKNILNPNNFPRTLCGIENGYQLDHKISIKRSFLMGLNPKIVGSLDNLQMLPWKQNRTKHYK